ncbi:hypothetical protein NL533_35970, partial [Klebsiella pneumoniae]|nr:hypothetical protein [Klebsiella pneumoniae]
MRPLVCVMSGPAASALENCTGDDAHSLAAEQRVLLDRLAEWFGTRFHAFDGETGELCHRSGELPLVPLAHI